MAGGGAAFVIAALRLFDFVEAVLTNFSYKLKAGKKLVIHIHDIFFKRADYRIVNAIFS